MIRANAHPGDVVAYCPDQVGPDTNRLLAVLNIAMADTAFTTWTGKRFYGSVPSAES